MISPDYRTSMEEDHNNNTEAGGAIKREKTSAEMRKSNKPLMERKRRERINNCLQQLKSILMEVTKKESSYYSKLEKADILEMTVKYLKNMKRQQLAAAMSKDPSILGKYIAGFNECTTEVTKYLNTVDGMNTDTRGKLLNHLANSLQQTSVSMATNTAVNNLQLSMNQTCGSVQPLGIQIPAATQLSTLPGSAGVCVLNQTQGNSAIQAIPASAMQLVPAKLPSGELVFLLANQQAAICQQNNTGLSVVSTVQNNVNNININPQSNISNNLIPNSVATFEGVITPATVNTLTPTQYSFPANVSAVSPLLLTPKGLSSPSSAGATSGASTSGSSPESDISESSSSLRSNQSRSSHENTPRRLREQESRMHVPCMADSDSSSESENNDDDIINNNNMREDSVIRGPMWRPW